MTKHWPLLLLALLTLLGGFIRFFRLSRPGFWIDEALVYWRICGTYAQLLGPLKNDGFGPLHYEADWVLGHFFKPTPFIIRLMPAICGTLMIPAIYFLARQLLPRRTALLAAAFTAFSGFLIIYSRDGKMYSESWLFVTLNVACLFWWFRTRKSTAWLCWIAAGCVAGGIHASTLVVIGLSPLFLLSQRKMHWKMALLWLVGTLVILSGPIGYYTKFNHFIDNVDERGWQATGIGWVDRYNRDRTGMDMVRYTGTVYLMGWYWPRAEMVEDEKIPEPLVTGPERCAEILGVMLILAILPWPKKWRPRADRNAAPEPPWRVFFWLGAWIVLPAYVFYCHSSVEFSSPTQWFDDLTPAGVDHLLGWHPLFWRYLFGIIVSAGIIAAYWFHRSRPFLIRFVQLLLAASVIFFLCIGIYKICQPIALDAMLDGKGWHSIWVPRYLGFTWPAMALSAAIMLMRLPTRPLRIAVIIFFLLINLGFGASRFLAYTEPPTDEMAADVHASQDPNSHVRTYNDIRFGRRDQWDASLNGLVGSYYFQMLEWHQPISPDEFKQIATHIRQWHGYSPATMAAEVRANPQLNRVIVWQAYDPKIEDAVDTIGPMLPGWKLVSEKWYRGCNYLDSYESRGSLRRREYVRK